MTIRPPEKGEYGQIAACFTEARGAGYYAAEYYDANWLEENCELYAAFDGGVLAGVAGISRGLFDEEKTTGCLLTVRPGFTGRGTAKSLIDHFTGILRERGAKAVKGQVVTISSNAQRTVERCGWVPTGFLYGARHGKNALVLYAAKLGASEAGTLHIHKDVVDLASRVYEGFGLKADIRGDIRRGETKLSHICDAHNRALYVHAEGCGAYLARDLESLRKKHDRTYSVSVLLNLCDVSAPYGYEALREAGYRFCGFDPLGRREYAVFYFGKDPAKMELTGRAERVRREVDSI